MSKAMIFAAGLGTRLKPLTDKLPKALVSVHGEPLLHILIRKLAAAGYNDIVVNVHHFADMIENYIDSLDIQDVTIKISDERDLLRETGGGVRHAECFLGKGNFLLHNVDIISNMDLRKFNEAFPSDVLSMLAVSKRDTTRYLLFDENMKLVGWTNTATGEIISPYTDLNPSDYRKFAFAGIHILSDKAFRLFDAEGFGEKFSIMDFYLKVADRYSIYGYVQPDLKVIDVGKPQSLKLLQEDEFPE